jgi:hypothetical protein
MDFGYKVPMAIVVAMIIWSWFSFLSVVFMG